MRERTLVILFSVILLTGTNVMAVDSSESREANVRARLDAFAAAWNAHNAKAMADIWSADGDLINPFGRAAHGRTEIEKLFQDEQERGLKNSTFKIVSSSVRFIEPEIAIVDADAELTGMVAPDGTPAPAMRPHLVAVMKKSAGKWSTISSRAFSYLPAPSPPASR